MSSNVLGKGAALGGSPTAADRRAMSVSSQRLIAWTGPGMIVLYIIGAVWLSRYFPPAVHPADSPEKVAQWYVDNQLRVQVGLVVQMLAYSLMCVWGASVAAQTRRKEGLFPVLTYVQLVSMAAGTAQIVVNVGLWMTATFRAGTINPEITQALNDAGFVILLGTWGPFTIWAIALGLNILLDKSDTPAFPRWLGYTSIWSGICFIPGGTVIFFKGGPFGWTGVICLWVPFVVFGTWILLFFIQTLKNIKAGYVNEQDLGD